jgi:hypothetical protein
MVRQCVLLETGSEFRPSLFWHVTQLTLIVGYRLSEQHTDSLGPIGCPETPVTNYQLSSRNIPEEQRS